MVYANAEWRSPQYKESNISSSEKGTCAAGNGLSGLTTSITHHQPDKAKGIYVHPIKVHHSDFGESTDTSPSTSTPEDDDLHPRPMIPPPEPRTLALASHNVHSIPSSTQDIAAWVNGEPDYWRPVDDRASILPLGNGTTRHSSDGSYAFVMPPLQPRKVAKETLCMGGQFEVAVPYSTQIELD